MKRIYEPSVHGHKTWGSSFLLMDYLDHNPMRRKSRVMEIGCGWGPASIFCAKRFGAKVTGVDMDKDVFPFLEVLSALNEVEVETLVSRYENLTTKHFENQKLVIGSDICFWDKLVKPLSKVINRALKAGVERVVIADPGRPTFYELSDLCAKKHDVELQEWYAVEPNHVTGEVLEIRARKS
ncbi:MAG: methyltransferase domain-containing protein [Pseudomonadota bacterium]